VTPGEVAAALRDLANRPAEVSRRRRIGPLFITALPSLFMLFSVSLAVLGAPEAVRLSGTLRRSGAALEDLAAAGDAPGRAATQRGLRLLRTRAYAELTDIANRSSDPVARRVAVDALDRIAPDEQAAIEALLREPPAAAAEFAAARRELETLQPSASLWALVLGFLLFGIAPLAIPALILAPLARGGGLLALFGMSLQTPDGRGASRLRSLARAAVVWTPFVVFQLWQPWTVFHVVFPLVLVVGIASTLARPARSIPDVIAGTWLVPR